VVVDDWRQACLGQLTSLETAICTRQFLDRPDFSWDGPLIPSDEKFFANSIADSVLVSEIPSYLQQTRADVIGLGE